MARGRDIHVARPLVARAARGAGSRAALVEGAAPEKSEAERRAQLPLDVMRIRSKSRGGLVAAGMMLYWSLPYLF